MILGAAAGFGWFLAFVIAQAAVLRVCPPGAWLGWTKRLAASALMLALLSPGALLRICGETALVQGGWPLGALWGALTFLGLFVLYMPFYYVVIASLSVRTLILLRAAGGHMPRADLVRNFTSERFVRDRLAAMAANGLLVRRDASYAITNKGAALARAALVVKALWKLGPGG